MQVVTDNIVAFVPANADAVEGLTNELYSTVLKYDEKLSVCEILGILKLLSDEISEEARGD